MNAYQKIPLDIPAGLNSDDTAFAASPGWVDGSNMRFRNGKAEVIGGFESVILGSLTGVCRSVIPWTDNTATLNIGFGTHSRLQLYQGGELFDITPASGFTPGAIDGAGSSGWGTGSYGGGDYGEPSVADYFPLTWSQGAWGQTLMASPRNQTIFQWANNTASVAAALTNAPAQVTYMLVAPQRQVFALGCSQEVGGVFNPLCIRHCDVGGETGWSTIASSSSTSREYVLPGGGRIVAGRVMGQYLLIWTTDALWLGTYVGQVTQVWRFDKVGDKCGLAGPGAAVVHGSTAYWFSPDRQFHSYTLQGFVAAVNCPIRGDIADNVAASQGDKIVASSISEFSEVRFDYPDSRDGHENSRYVALCIEGPDAGAWYRGQMKRTAMVDAGPSAYPLGITFEGKIYWHEKGNSSDGGVFPWFIETADTYLDENYTLKARTLWPDIAGQIGAVTLDVTTYLFPQGDAATWGPYVLQPSMDQVDFVITGRLFRLRFSGNSAPTKARIGRQTVDAKRCGRK